jgi:hypothetical protein
MPNVREVSFDDIGVMRRKQMAQAIRQQAASPLIMPDQGRVASSISPWAGAAKLGEALLARRASSAADAAERDRNASLEVENREMIRQMFPASDGEVTGPAMPHINSDRTVTNGVPLSARGEELAMALKSDPRGANQFLAQQIMQSAFSSPEFERVEAGDRIIILDKRTQEVVGELPIGYSPDAALAANTTMRGQDINRDTALQGFGVTMRGQDIGSKTAAADRVSREGIAAMNEAGANARASMGGAKNQTEYEKKAGILFGEMMDAANQFQPGKADTSSKWNAMLGSNPVTNVFTSSGYRGNEAAGLRWAQNYLYLKSGQAAPAEEVNKTMVQYLPQPGDDPENVEQKAVAREQAMDNISAALGIPRRPKPDGEKVGGTAGSWDPDLVSRARKYLDAER